MMAEENKDDISNLFYLCLTDVTLKCFLFVCFSRVTTSRTTLLPNCEVSKDKIAAETENLKSDSIKTTENEKIGSRNLVGKLYPYILASMMMVGMMGKIN